MRAKNPAEMVETEYCEHKAELLAALEEALEEPAPSADYDADQAAEIIRGAIESIEADTIPHAPVEGWEYWTGFGGMFDAYALWRHAVGWLEADPRVVVVGGKYELK